METLKYAAGKSPLHIINKTLKIFLFGTLGFVIVSLISIAAGIYFVFEAPTSTLRFQSLIVVLAGFVLLKEILQSFSKKSGLPSDYQLVTRSDYPKLFNLIDEVTSNLNLTPPKNVYVCPDATAAIFTLPRSYNLIIRSPRNLLVGMAFLTQFDDDEMRAVLYHEFGHYAQKEMEESSHVYTVGEISRSFVRLEDYDGSMFSEQLQWQLMSYMVFVSWSFRHINEAFSKLSASMEYQADDVAVRYVGAATLRRALLHALSVKFCYDATEWGRCYLMHNNMDVTDKYAALRMITAYARIPKNLVSGLMLSRIERLSAEDNNRVCRLTALRDSVTYLPEANSSANVMCTPYEFAEWMREGVGVYKDYLYSQRSVYVEIHLRPHRHRYPLFDGYYRIAIDEDRILGECNYRKGFTIRFHTSPGKHFIKAYFQPGIKFIPIEYDYKENGAYHIEMDYKMNKRGYMKIFAESIDPIIK